MRINTILKESISNGPGKRGVVWVQGCDKACKGCFNQEAQSYCGGYEMSPEEILKEFDLNKIEGLTVSGGEPFDQREELKKLLTLAEEKQLNTLVYSGYVYEQLLSNNFEVLRHCNYIIDGPYMKDKPSKCRWAGSGNQRFLQLKDGHIEKNLTESEDYSQTAEIFIEESGNITITGFLEA